MDMGAIEKINIIIIKEAAAMKGANKKKCAVNISHPVYLMERGVSIIVLQLVHA